MPSLIWLCLIFLFALPTLGNSKAATQLTNRVKDDSRLSPFGQLNSSTYPFYIEDQGHSAPPWISNASSWFDPSQVLETGITRYYDFTVSRSLASPDGYLSNVTLINDQFPGPLIEANWGDWIQVTLHNELCNPEEGTALHWHGLRQQHLPWYDGVPSVSQCPITPGTSFAYKFRADLFGSSWYHSHYSAQSAGGLFGPMLIHGPSQSNYDIDLGPVIIMDWYHKDYLEILEGALSTDPYLWFPNSQSNLIDGLGQFNCSLAQNDNNSCNPDQPLAQFRFLSGKIHRLRLINAGSEGFEYFTIDGHTMTVIANDFTPVEPYNTTVVSLGVSSASLSREIHCSLIRPYR